MIIDWFARNSVAANLLMALLVIGGLIASVNVTSEVMPEISLDRIYVEVPYLGAAPEEVEEAVCVRIEEAIYGIDGIKQIVSTASEGMGSVMIELELGADIRRVLDDVKGRVDAIDTFPVETEKPIIRELVARAQVVDLAVSGYADEFVLKEIAERVRDELAALPDISLVEVTSARPYEISIEVSETALRRHGLTFDDVAAAVRNSSLDLPGGSVRSDSGEVLLRTIGQAYRGDEYEALPLLTRADGTRLVLGDVATVVDGFAETDQSARFNLAPTVLLSVFRTGDQDALDIADRVEQYAARTQATLPEGISITVWQNVGEIIDSQLRLMLRTGGTGFLLVFILLSLFLELRLAFWVSLGIPISFLGAIMLMPGLGLTLNFMSLFAFILVLGIVVDDAIIVGENIYAHQERHGEGLRGSIEGAREIATPVIFAVLTTVAAFMPLLFVPGMMGKVFSVIPLVVVPCLLFSLVESLNILPAHLSHIPARRRAGPWRRFQRHFADGLKCVHPPRLPAGPGGGAPMAVRHRGDGPVDADRDGRHRARRLDELPLLPQHGSPVHVGVADDAPGHAGAGNRGGRATDRGRRRQPQARADRRDRRGLLRPHLHGHRRPAAGLAPGGMGPVANAGAAHLGEVVVELAASETRAYSSEQLGNRWRELTGAIPEAVDLKFNASAMSAGEELDVMLVGPNMDRLRAAAEDVKAELRGYTGVYGVTDSFRAGKREMKLGIRPGAESLGLSLEDLGRQVRQAFYGEEAQRIQRGRDDIRVMVRYPLEERRSLGDLENMRIRTPGGGEVPFSHVASVDPGRGFASIKRVDRDRAVNVTAAVDEGVTTAGAVIEDLRARVLPEVLPRYPGVRFVFEGLQAEQEEATTGLQTGFTIAMLVIYALLAIPLKSYIQPLIIMSAIPFGLIGAVWGHAIMGMDVTLMSMFGLVALAGVVVNDSLVMVAFINRKREQHAKLEVAVREAGVARFRAILLTSLTTFFGLAPLMIVESFDAMFVVPMAVSLAFGVIFATFITLVLVPTSYLIIEDIKRLPRLLLRRQPARRRPHGSARQSPR